MSTAATDGTRPRARWRTALVHVVLVCMTIWPLVQLALVKRYDVSPWKLCGLGMYAEPRFGMLGFNVQGRVRTTGELQPLTAPPPELQIAANDYLERHRWLRRLAAFDDFARAALALHPEWGRLYMSVHRPVLDPATGMVVMKQVEMVYPP